MASPNLTKQNENHNRNMNAFYKFIENDFTKIDEIIKFLEEFNEKYNGIKQDLKFL